MVNRLWKLVFGQGLVTTAGRLRLAGDLADPPRVARLARLRVRRQRLGRPGDAQADGDVRGLPPVIPAAPRSTCNAIPATAGSRARTPSGSMPSSSATTPWRSAGCSRTRSAGRASSPISRRATGCSSISPRASIIPTTETTSIAAASTPTGSGRSSTQPAGLRRLDARGMRRPAPAVEHAAPGPGPARTTRPTSRRRASWRPG